MKIFHGFVPFFFLLSFMACQQKAQTEIVLESVDDVPPEIAKLLKQSDSNVDQLTGIRCKVLYSFKAAGSSDTSHNVYAAELQALPDDSFGFRVAANKLGGYHVLYDGTSVYAGDLASGRMKYIDSTKQPASWMQKSFAAKARIGWHHGVRLSDKIRQSEIIKSATLHEIQWEGKTATNLHLQFGAKDMITGGSIDVVFRSEDSLPVSVSEVLDLVIDGKKQRQFMSVTYIEIEKNPVFETGHFGRAALPADLELIQ